MRLPIALCTFVVCCVVVCLGQTQSTAPAPPTMEPAPATPAQKTKDNTSAANHKPHSVTLKWQESKTKGIEGYYVYRADGGKVAKFVRLTPRPIKETEFRDLHVKPGKSYVYAVSAVQNVGGKEIESALTPPVTAQIPKP